LQIIQEIIDGVVSPLGIASTLLAAEIMIMFKNLRHNRPRDYHGVSFLGLIT
jgi:hypothetical protein